MHTCIAEPTHGLVIHSKGRCTWKVNVIARENKKILKLDKLPMHTCTTEPTHTLVIHSEGRCTWKVNMIARQNKKTIKLPMRTCITEPTHLLVIHSNKISTWKVNVYTYARENKNINSNSRLHILPMHTCTRSKKVSEKFSASRYGPIKSTEKGKG